jgi:hypothetical protein
MRILAVGVGLLVSSFLPVTANAASPEVKQAAKALGNDLKARGFKALIGLHVHGFHYVRPDGSPIEGKKQSKRKGSKGLFTKDFAVAPGEMGRGIDVRLKGNDKLWFLLGKKGGFSLAWNPSSVEVHFEREITPADLTPEMAARALSSLVEFQGLRPGAELDDLLGDLGDAPAPPTAERAAPRGPGLFSLVPRVDPARVRPGGTLDLLLDFEVVAAEGAAVQVQETRTVESGGQALPGFPRVATSARTSGRFTSSSRLLVPAAAAPGEYRYRGEVCLDGDCISRSVSFVVAPD